MISLIRRLKNENIILLRRRMRLSALTKIISCNAYGIKERDYVLFGRKRDVRMRIEK